MRDRRILCPGCQSCMRLPRPDSAGIDACTLTDDGQWHSITIDVRKVREAIKGLKYLRRFIFYTNWRKDEKQEFRFDDFAILPR